MLTDIGRVAAAVALLAGPVAAADPARADDPVKLVGTWKGTAQVVQIGANPYRVSEGNGPQFPANGLEFTFSITEQQGNRFAGTATGGRLSETLIGAISPDNRSGYILDNDGEYAFTIRDAETLDLCYRHSYPSGRVVGCYAVRRSAN
ncbi:MAG: hypothetical protein ABWY78_18250 [Microvirga sp.]